MNWIEHNLILIIVITVAIFFSSIVALLVAMKPDSDPSLWRMISVICFGLYGLIFVWATPIVGGIIIVLSIVLKVITHTKGA